MTKVEIQAEIQRIFGQYLGIPSTVSQNLVPLTIPAGKLYEAHVLSHVVKRLAIDEGYELTLVGGTKLQLKSGGGPINRRYPRIELKRSDKCVAELWTDITFNSLSYSRRASPRTATRGDYHELDILIVDPGLPDNQNPEHHSIWLGVECKNTGYEKNLLREILGIRRELSLLTDARFTKFTTWPRSRVPADPPSCLLVYATDRGVLEYSAPGAVFGIDFEYDPM